MATRTAQIPVGSAALQLGEQLRNARLKSGLKLKVAAERAGTSETTLSLLERGHRSVDADLLEKIVGVVGADGSAAFRLADLLPPQAAADVLGAEVAGALSSGGLTVAGRRALRRVHLKRLASEITAGLVRPPVDLEQLLDSRFGLEVRAVTGLAWGAFAGSGLIEYPEDLDEDGRRADRNFLMGHMAGHAALAAESGRRPVCNFAAGGLGEAEATWVAGLLLLPRKMLEPEAQVLAGTYDLARRGGFGDFVAEIADAFGVPDWVAASHLADAGLLAWAAGQEGL